MKPLTTQPTPVLPASGLLAGPKGTKPLRYKPSFDTDIRKTFARFRREMTKAAK